MQNVVFRARREQLRAYDAVARSRGVSRSEFIRSALDQAVRSMVETGRLHQELKSLHAEETALLAELKGGEGS